MSPPALIPGGQIADECGATLKVASISSHLIRRFAQFRLWSLTDHKGTET